LSTAIIASVEDASLGSSLSVQLSAMARSGIGDLLEQQSMLAEPGGDDKGSA
jgi:hypothetical protein